MKKMVLVLLVAMCLCLAGCGEIRHDYSWKEYSIDPERITSDVSLVGSNIKVIKGSTDTAERNLGNVSIHNYYSNLQHLNDSIVEQLKIELRKKGAVINGSGKTIKITLNSAEFVRGMWKIAADFKFTVELGNGKKKELTIRNSSPTTVDRTYDGAVAISVINIMNDQEIMDYLKK